MLVLDPEIAVLRSLCYILWNKDVLEYLTTLILSKKFIVGPSIIMVGRVGKFPIITVGIIG